MSKIEVGVGEDFPINDAETAGGDPHAYRCGGRRAHWAKRRATWEARRAARRERWARFCAFWSGERPQSRPEKPKGDASYSDVPPFKTSEG